jgi:hypothetical protein
MATTHQIGQSAIPLLDAHHVATLKNVGKADIWLGDATVEKDGKGSRKLASGKSVKVTKRLTYGRCYDSAPGAISIAHADVDD